MDHRELQKLEKLGRKPTKLRESTVIIFMFKIMQKVPNLPFVSTGFGTTTFSYHKSWASNEAFPLKIISKSSSLTYSGK